MFRQFQQRYFDMMGRPDWHAANLHSWAKKHKIGTEPVGQWLGRKRTAALGNALRKM